MYIVTMKGKVTRVDTRRQTKLCLYKASKLMSMQVTGRNIRHKVH